jgi:TolB-like protein/DNA-binding winged helix-turn-helix (wHTH) protein/Tfp pilus assembly protein PilF
MEEFPASVRAIRFGVFQVDLREQELSKKGIRLKLQSQPFAILLTLLSQPGKAVSRDELRRKLWPDDVFIDFDHSLGTAVNKLREVLDDSADNPRFVETLPRRGYRFIAPVELIGEDAATSVVKEAPADRQEPPPSEPKSDNDDQVTASNKTHVLRNMPRSLVWKRSGFLLFVLVATLLSWILYSRSRSLSGIRSLAVLPLENLSGDASQDYFSEGMTDELITELGQIGGLRVISRTSAMTYKGVRRSLPEIARELNVDAVVEGTVLRSGNQVRITAQLIQGAADRHLWAKSYEGDLRDTLALQKQVAASIAEAIRVELTPHEQAVLKTVKKVNPDAYEDYLKGRYFWNKRTADGFKKSIDYFNKAIDQDPTYAPAYSGLADAYALSGDWEYGVLPPKDAYPKAKAAATKALELDSNLGEAHVSLAFALDAYDWDWESAGREFKRGIELNPGYATGHHWYAWHLTTLERESEAIGEMKKAESLDPLSLIISDDLAEEFLIAHRYDQAMQQSRKTIEMDSSFAVGHYELGQVFVQKHAYEQAIGELLKSIELSGGSMTCTSNLAYAYAVSGRRSEALKILDDLKNRSTHGGYSNAPEIALVYVGLNDKDQAMLWLERAYQERFNPSILFRPSFDSLRADARFRDLLRRIGLSQ